MLFASIAPSGNGERPPVWPSRIFGVLAAAPMFTGLYAYSLGFTAMLATLKLLQLRAAVARGSLRCADRRLQPARLRLSLPDRRGVRGLASGTSRARHVWSGSAGGRRPESRSLALVLFPGVVAGGRPSVPLDQLCRGSRSHRLSASSSPGRLAAAAPLVWFFALWGLGSVLFYVVPSPLGDNWTRLSAFIFPVMLLTASLANFRPRRLVVFSLAAAFAFNFVPYALLVPSRLGNDTQLGELLAARRSASSGSTTGRRASGSRSCRPRSTGRRTGSRRPASPLARGWYRQLDVVDNPTLYANHLDAAVIPVAGCALMPFATPSSARPRRSTGTAGRRKRESCARRDSGLKAVFRSPNWTIYVNPHATPLLTGPASPVVTSFGHTAIRGRVFAAGRYLLRSHYSPYLRLAGKRLRPSQAPDKMTYLDVTRPERFALSVPGTPDGLVRELFGNTEAATCGSVGGLAGKPGDPVPDEGDAASSRMIADAIRRRFPSSQPRRGAQDAPARSGRRA